MIEKSITIVSTGMSRGIVTLRKRAQALAPSIEAASYRSIGMVCRPASSEMAKNGVPRQMLTKITEPIASAGSPRKPEAGKGIPSGRNSHGSGVSVAWKISTKANVDSAVGTIYGSSTLARMTARNGKYWFMTSARARPRPSLKTVAVPV